MTHQYGSSHHVVMLVQNLPVPLDRRVWTEARSLRASGIRVSVVSPSPDGDATEVDRTEIEGISVHRYPPPPPSDGKLSYLREYWYAFRQTAMIVHQLWRDDPFTVIHTANPPDIFWLIARRYRRRGVRFVFDHHDLVPELYETKFGRRGLMHRGLLWLEKMQFRSADRVISTNETYRSVALTRGDRNPEDVTVVRSAPRIDELFPVDPDPSLRRGRKYYGVYLGVMNTQDGVDVALEAIKRLVDDGFTDAYYTFIGDGDHQAALVERAHRLELDDHVEFTGRITEPQELRRYLSSADLGIAPDIPDPYTTACTMNKIVEYMAHALPIVSFNLAESRVSAGDAALFVSRPDADGLAMGIRELFVDRERRTEMGLAGRERFVSELAWNFSEERLLDMYRGLSVASDGRAEVR